MRSYASCVLPILPWFSYFCMPLFSICSNLPLYRNAPVLYAATCSGNKERCSSAVRTGNSNDPPTSNWVITVRAEPHRAYREYRAPVLISKMCLFPALAKNCKTKLATIPKKKIKVKEPHPYSMKMVQQTAVNVMITLF